MIRGFVRDNPIFVRYGQVVDHLFREGQDTGRVDPFTLVLELQEVTLPDFEYVGKRLAEYADPQELAFIQANVDRLRRALHQEQEEVSRLSASHASVYTLSSPTLQKLKEFRESLAKGNEAMLEENPFYELTALLWRLHSRALQQAFADHLPLNLRGQPHAIKVARSFAQIWKSQREILSPQEKLREFSGKIASIGKFTLGLILFIGSTLTTAKGVIDLVQLPSFVELFGGWFSGSQNEGMRLTLSIIVGLVLSSTILDFKSRLFQGVAEMGRVFSGYAQAFRRNPRWVVIAMVLTAMSIWTNYDGIVLLMSKTEDLTWQWRRVQKDVQQSLGHPDTVHVDDPDSLWDLYAVLQRSVSKVVADLNRLPQDEMSGAASSGVAQKGPRYWGKHFIVYGGYQPGSQDVSHAMTHSAMTQKIDAMLRESGLDLSQSLEQQLLKLLEDYRKDLAVTDAEIQRKMIALERMMSVGSFSIPELVAFFSLESYHVDEKVKEVVALMESNTQRYLAVVDRMEKLAGSAIALLVQVDQVGGVVKNDYNIHINIQVPRLDSIESLKKGSITRVQRRNLQELKTILLERYGMALGSGILFFILFVAISMDLSDPIFYSAMVARWGRRDRHFLDENIQTFKKWEREIVQNIRVFLMRPDIRSALPHILCPPMATVHWTWHLFLESLDAQLKDDRSLKPMERFRYWFFELFQASRIRYVRDYNNRLQVTTRLLTNPDHLSSRFLNRLYGGLFGPFRVGVDHFDVLHHAVSQTMRRQNEVFEQELHRSTENLKGEGAPRPSITELRWSVVKERIALVWHVLFVQTLEREESSFPLSRYNWLGNLTMIRLSSRALQERLSRYDTIIKEFLEHDLPRIHSGVILPIRERLSSIPNRDGLSRVMQVGAMEEEFSQINEGVVTLYGMSQSREFQLDNVIMNSVLESTQVDEILEMVLKGDPSGTALRQRLWDLENRLHQTLAIMNGLMEDREEVVVLLTGVRKNYLRPLQNVVNGLRIRDVYEKACGLDQLRHELNIYESLAMNLWCDDISGSPTGSKHGTNLAMELFRQGAATSGFFLLDSAKALEARFSKMKKWMDSQIFLLNFVDRLIGKMLDRIHQSYLLVANILIREGELRAQIGSGAPSDPRIEFLDDNFLFMRSIPLSLNEERGRIWFIAGQNTLTEEVTMKQLRDMDREGFKLMRNLQKICDFLDGQGEMPVLTSQDLRDESDGDVEVPLAADSFLVNAVAKRDASIA
ncbi:MAG: hypothetical protein HQL77_15450 [Magnetococcales bacterium]|nr:hypothetical protein [Magnetococcales bacterium]